MMTQAGPLPTSAAPSWGLKARAAPVRARAHAYSGALGGLQRTWISEAGVPGSCEPLD